jgi:hypothetical protein
MCTRRQFLTRSSLGVMGTAGTCLAFPGDAAPGLAEVREGIPDGSASRGMINTRAEEAIRKGLDFLQSRRDRDGSFGTIQYRGNVAVTSLAAMAFMCAGHQPNRGRAGKVILDALRFVLSKENVRGPFGRSFPGFLHNPIASPHGPMYGHGFATLFLAEVSGMIHDRNLRKELSEKLHLAVKLILDAQTRNREHAWRYMPNSGDADLSVTICQIMALRSARNAGVFIPKSAVDRCTQYVIDCQDLQEGFFRYMKQGGQAGGPAGFARTAAGVAALNSAGYYLNMDTAQIANDEERRRAQKAVDGHYYAVQCMWTAGGAYWAQWYPAVRDELLSRQNPDGSWVDQICSHYGTAMACIILQVPNNYLPILQK